MTIEHFSSLLERWGFPVCILFVIGWFFYTKIWPAVTNHITMMDERASDRDKAVSDRQVEYDKFLRGLVNEQREINRTVVLDMAIAVTKMNEQRAKDQELWEMIARSTERIAEKIK